MNTKELEHQITELRTRIDESQSQIQALQIKFRLVVLLSDAVLGLYKEADAGKKVRKRDHCFGDERYYAND
tara:strand:- start:8777 stop:8989 length:213 start_codon:yes stop_codon:yes gene_type:complete